MTRRAAALLAVAMNLAFVGMAAAADPAPLASARRPIVWSDSTTVYVAWGASEGAAAGRRAALVDSTGTIVDTLEVAWTRDALSALRPSSPTGSGALRFPAASWIEPIAVASRPPHGRFAVALGALPTTLDPALATSLADKQVATQMFEGLVRLDAELEPVPAAAARFERVGPRWRFHLRPDARFHDGRPVRAADVRATLERALSPVLASPRVEGLAAAIAGGREFHAGRTRSLGAIALVDSLTVDIQPSSSRAPLLSELAMPAAFLVPAEHAGAVEADPAFARAPVGSGPFRLVRSDTTGVQLVAAPGRTGGPDTLELRFERSPQTAALDFELGRLDAVSVPEAVASEILASGRADPTSLRVEEASTYYLGFDTRNPFLADRAHRLALAGAIDRELAVKVLVPERGTLARGLLPPALAVPGTVDPWQPARADAEARARSLARRAPELQLWLPTGSPTGLRLAEFVAAAYRRLGLRVRIVERPWAEFERGVEDGRADLFYLSWFADGPDPVAFVASLVASDRRGRGGNRTRYANPAVDSALDAARRATDEESGAAALRRAESLALRDAPLVPLFHSVNVTLVRAPGITGLVLDPLGAPRYDTVEVSPWP
jgi:ABC-type transport system substrate-binding protein